MHKLIAFFILLFVISHTTFSQTHTFSWVKPITGETGPNPQVQITDMVTDPTGNTYMTGLFGSIIDFGSGITLAGHSDDISLFLVKYDTDGTPLWARKGTPMGPFGSSLAAKFPQIALDGAFNIYWSGSYISESLVFGDSAVVISSTCADCEEGYLLKVDTHGNFIFGKSLRAAEGKDLHIKDIAADFFGRFYLTGTYTGTEIFLGNGTSIGNLVSGGCFLAACSPTGEVDWVTFQTNPNGLISQPAIAISPDGTRIVVTGKYTGTGLDFGNNVTTSGAATTINKTFAVWYDTGGIPVTAGTLEAANFVDLLDFKVDDQHRLWAICNFWPQATWNGQTFAAASTDPIIIGSMLTILAPWLPPVDVMSVTDTPNSSLPIMALTLAPGNRFYTSGSSDQFLQNIPGVAPVFTTGIYDLILTGGVDDTLEWARSAGGEGAQATVSTYPGSVLTSDVFQNLYLVGYAYEGNFDGITLEGISNWIGKLSATATSIQELGNPSSLQIKPNPARTDVEITFPENAVGICRVLSVNGRQVAEIQINTPRTTFNTSNWPAGVYVVEFTIADGRRITEKLIVQR